MPFITKGKTNWKFLLIVAILAAVVGGGILVYWNKSQKEIITINQQIPQIQKTQTETISDEITIEKNNCEKEDGIENKGRCYGKLAVKYNDSNFCEGIGEGGAKWECYNYLGTLNLDTEQCNKIPNEIKGKYSPNSTLRQECNFWVAYELKDLEFCYGEPLCIVAVVALKEDPELCNEIENLSIRKLCEESLGEVDVSSWKTNKDEANKIEFKYPEYGFPTFIELIDCDFEDFIKDSCPDTEKVMTVVNGITFCSSWQETGVAAGNSYSSYTIAAFKEGKCLILGIDNIRTSKCGAPWEYECLFSNTKQWKEFEKIPYTIKFLE